MSHAYRVKQHEKQASAVIGSLFHASLVQQSSHLEYLSRADYSDAYLSKIILHAKGRVSRINEIPAFFSFFFSPSSRHEQAHRLPTTRWLCDQMHVLLSSLSDTEFSSSNIEQRLQEWMQHANQTSQKKEVYSQLRLIITGSKVSCRSYPCTLASAYTILIFLAAAMAVVYRLEQVL